MYCGVKYVFIFINTFCVYIFAVYGMTLQHMYKCNEQIRAIRVSIPQAFTFLFFVLEVFRLLCTCYLRSQPIVHAVER